MEKNDRNQKLAEIKSSIELLEECKQKILNNKKLDEKGKQSRINDIDEAIKENYDKAKLTLQASKKEVDNSSYGNVSEEYKAKYAERLKARGLTDEQLHQKEQAIYVFGSGETETKRTRRRNTKRAQQRADEEGFDSTSITRVDNEEELMKSTLIKNDKELSRRRHNRTTTVSDVPQTPTYETAIGEVMEQKKVKPREEFSVSANVNTESTDSKDGGKRVLTSSGSEKVDYNFDLSSIPSHIQYDILPLPSKGECYSHKKSRIPVAYLTAADENIIASPNMYRDGKVINTILSRKILDKDIKVEELCQGDRDAIVLWLRATGYGTDFPIVAKHPDTQKEYSINVKLDSFKYYPFNLVGDENGYFEYVTSGGDVIKFKYLNLRDDEEVRNEIISKVTNNEKFSTIKYLQNLTDSIKKIDMSKEERSELEDCIADMKDIIGVDNMELNMDDMYSFSVTNQMFKYTMSVNGNEDRGFIKNYIDNMRARDAYDYRMYVNDNTPGVNMKITVKIPESDGGGTFDTFLGISEYVFSNI